MSHVVVLPSIWQPYTEECLATWKGPRERVLVVDNTVVNRGVAASWNLGRTRVIDEHADWLVVMSAATRFGPAGGIDFLDALDAHAGAVAVEAGWGVGWHLIAFSRRCLEVVGAFDENFYPGYMEDLDYARRVRVAGLAHEPPPFWRKVDIDCWVQSFAHSERFAGVRADGAKLAAYYEAKWGAPTSVERFDHPFGDPTHDHTWWPTPPDPRALTR